jgi:hypothetical protein
MSHKVKVVNKRRSTEEHREIDGIVERLREFVRLNYVSAGEVARRMGFREETVYSWIKGQSRPAEPERITAFLDSLPAEPHSGIAPVGYQYREYKNWRRYPEATTVPVL